MMVCSQCFNEWDPKEVDSSDKIFDSNGNELQNGDSVAVSYTHLDVYKRQVFNRFCGNGVFFEFG